MILRADNSSCTTTFPQCTRWRRLTWRKAYKLKNFGEKYFISMPTIYQVSLHFFSYPVFVLQRLV